MLTIVWLTVVSLATPSACSNIPTLPSETAKAAIATAIGFTPKPTEKAILEHDNLLERQSYFATCGYYSGVPVTCAAGFACATNTLNYASCCPMNNIIGCNIFISCVDYPSFASSGFNPYLYNYNTGICTNMAMPYCFTKIWNYATRYTELGCNTQAGYVVLDPNPDVHSGPVNAPPQSNEPTDEQEPDTDTDTNGQNIDGNQNTQISGDNNTINYMGGDGDGGDDGGDSGRQNGVASRLSCWSMYITTALMLLTTGLML